jgi:hypothetical protein
MEGADGEVAHIDLLLQQLEHLMGGFVGENKG